MAATIVEIAEIYALIGLGVAALFLAWGIDRVEEGARGSYAFRPLLIPGIVLIWPLVLWRWAALEQGAKPGQAAHRPPRRLQDVAQLIMAAAIPIILFTALLVRQDGPTEQPAVQLAEPPGTAQGGETAQ